MIIPILVFISVWILQIVLYYFSPYPYHHISSDTWFITFVSTITVVVGYLTVYFTDFKLKLNIKKLEVKKDKVYFNKRKLEISLIVLSLFITIAIIGDIIFLASEIISLNLDPYNIFWYRFVFLSYVTDSTKVDLIHSIFSYIRMLNSVSILISAIYFAKYNEKKILSFLPLILPLIYSIFTLQRFLFVLNLVLWVAGINFIRYFFDTKSFKIATRRLINAILSMSFFLAFILLMVIVIRFNIDTGGSSTDTLVDLGVKSIYSYFAGNIVALEHFLSTDIEFQYGLVIFRSIAKWLARFDLIDSSMVVAKHMKFVNLGPIYGNVYTYIRLFYEDFGIIGLMILSYVWGILGAVIIKSLFKKFNLVKLLLSAYIFFSYFMSFYSYALQNLTQFAFLILWAFLLNNIILEKSNTVEDEVLLYENR